MSSETTADLTDATCELLSGLYTAAAGGDIEGFLGRLHDDVEILEPSWLPYGGTHRGIDGVTALVGEASKLVDLATVRLETLVAEGEHAFGVVSAKAVGGGEPLVITEEWTVRNGKAWRCRVSWFDPVGMSS